MLSNAGLWCILVLVIFEHALVAAKTYYFNQNKTTNEFLIYNRVNLNKSIQNYPSNREYLSELRNISAMNNAYIKRNATEKKLSYPILDPEWEYDEPTNKSRSELPTFIHQLYETISKTSNNSVIYGPTRILFNIMPLNSTIIKFNLSSLNLTKDNITDVDLYFHFSVDRNMKGKSLVLRLYQIEDHTNITKKSSIINPDAHKLLNVIYIREAESGWQIFKLKSGVKNWMKGQKNLGVIVTISKPNENQFSIYRDGNSNASRTFAVVETRDVEAEGQLHGKETILQPNSCRKHSHYIDLKKSNWGHFVVAPEGYSAFSCYGKCYRNDNGLPNHARMLNSGEVSLQTAPCCAPTEYIPLTIMYYDKFGNIAIKVYQDMIVAYCGCR